MSKYSKFHSHIPFIDTLMNQLGAFIFLFVMAFIMLTLMTASKNMDSNIVPKGEFMATMSWPDGNKNDIDLWMQGPNGEIIFYANKDENLIHLDHDDLGTNDAIVGKDGKTIVASSRQEVITVRGIQAGEYIVNVYFYRKNQPGDVPVEVRVYKLNPFSIIFSGTVTLKNRGDEVTVVRFTLNDKGEVISTNNLQKNLSRDIYSRDPALAPGLGNYQQ